MQAVDALALAKLVIAALAAFIWIASPLFALGVVFGLPLLAAVVLLILRWLYSAATGRRVGFGALDESRRVPPQRLGLPVWYREQKPRESGVATTKWRAR